MTKDTKKSADQTPEQILIEQLNEQIAMLEADKKKLESGLAEAEQTTKRAQNEYVNIKFDMDRLQRQVDEAKKTAEKDALIKSLKKILPFVDELRKSLEVMSDDQASQECQTSVKDSKLAEGVQLVYDKFLSTLAEMNIYPIEALGFEPDMSLHEPVSAQPVDDDTLKGKITSEFTR
ncbi:MAG: nucleotide exchange factor GrpE [Candidatus Peribacteria bacterium]|nr:MAG: nucleotide exchange factor GrpE [Candidatus Peribacteria bacterium]